MARLSYEELEAIKAEIKDLDLGFFDEKNYIF